MARSLKKGPFVDYKLERKIDAQRWCEKVSC